ncbi:hypothetical protein [Chitinophaga rhizophila]|uniref:Uncharacterized protein n=1 Tax=Chitinophaga rhizophila TaxID=2866212 RepID=A0ABS7GJ75_9BACT|nr:hypothetical protein [Chitinophaga rhizophila]MBW8687270.1 hypothetical protein [Chitinophaga rhizophila]
MNKLAIDHFKKKKPSPAQMEYAYQILGILLAKKSGFRVDRRYTVKELATTIRVVYAINVQYDEAIGTCYVGDFALNLKLNLLNQLVNLSDKGPFLFSYCNSKGIVRVLKKVAM